MQKILSSGSSFDFPLPLWKKQVFSSICTFLIDPKNIWGVLGLHGSVSKHHHLFLLTSDLFSCGSSLAPLEWKLYEGRIFTVLCIDVSLKLRTVIGLWQILNKWLLLKEWGAQKERKKEREKGRKEGRGGGRERKREERRKDRIDAGRKKRRKGKEGQSVAQEERIAWGSWNQSIDFSLLLSPYLTWARTTAVLLFGSHSRFIKPSSHRKELTSCMVE